MEPRRLVFPRHRQWQPGANRARIPGKGLVEELEALYGRVRQQEIPHRTMRLGQSPWFIEGVVYSKGHESLLGKAHPYIPPGWIHPVLI